MGVTVENNDVVNRIDLLRNTNAAIKFLSCEPLLSSIPNMNLENIDWVIVGGESGRSPRLMKQQWVFDILKQCEKANVKFFFKQWGGLNKKKNGRIINGKTYDDMPSIREEFAFFNAEFIM